MFSIERGSFGSPRMEFSSLWIGDSGKPEQASIARIEESASIAMDPASVTDQLPERENIFVKPIR